MLIKIALNGARTKEESNYIPHTLSEIEKEVRQLYNFGCNVFHIHCYNEYGKESLNYKNVGNLVSTLKNISSEIQLGISSGEWIEPELKHRKSQIEDWEIFPDFISVNMIEEDAIEISQILISKGIKIEAGLNEKKAAE